MQQRGAVRRGHAALKFRDRLEQAEQLQVGDVLDDHRRADVRDVVVRTDFRFLHGGAEPVGRRERAAGRLGGLQVLRIAQQQQEHLQDRVLALPFRQAAQAGLEALQPLPKSPTRSIG